MDVNRQNETMFRDLVYRRRASTLGGSQSARIDPGSMLPSACANPAHLPAAFFGGSTTTSMSSGRSGFWIERWSVLNLTEPTS
jgi:hypothetical protein